MTSVSPDGEVPVDLWPEDWASREPPPDYELPPEKVVAEAIRAGKEYAIAAVLPEEFWERPVLKHIRDAAYSRSLAADAVLGVTLARLSSMMHHDLKIDFGLGVTTANIFTGLYGPPGAGKSSSAHCAYDLLGPPPYLADFPDGLGIGSGEGIAELFMGTVEGEESFEEQIAAGRKKPRKWTKRRQVRHNAFLYVDEGTTIIKLGVERKGSILGESIRSSWSGSTLGQANAREETTRLVPAHSYSLGMAVGFQQLPAEKLLEDSGTGTPQRFLWVSAIDPRIPNEDVPWPGPLHTGLIDDHHEPVTGVIMPPEFVRQFVSMQGKLRRRGEIEVSVLEEHDTLMRCKIASLLAILDERSQVADEDWELAQMVMKCSNATRDRIVELARQRRQAEVDARHEEAATRAVVVQAALTSMDADVLKMAQRVNRKVAESERQALTMGQINKLFDAKKRHLAEAAVDYAIKSEWIFFDGARYCLRTPENVHSE